MVNDSYDTSSVVLKCAAIAINGELDLRTGQAEAEEAYNRVTTATSKNRIQHEGVPVVPVQLSL